MPPVPFVRIFLRRTPRVRSPMRLPVLVALLAAVVCPCIAAAQTVTGRVTAQDTGEPLSDVSVVVSGTSLITVTNADGRYTLQKVPAGAQLVRVMRVGYHEQKKEVTVTDGQSVTADFALVPAPIQLTAVVVTATGEQRRVEVGNAVGQVNAAQAVANTAVSDMGDLMVARTPGVMVFSPTQTGAGTRIRIRGTSSLSLSNNPIYIIDGVRVEGTTGSSSVSVGGTTPSRINDINPEEIESIEVVRGPSAATLYGTDAANGVIVIRTKHGTAGPAQLTYFTEQGFHVDENTYPTAYRGWRTCTTTSTNSTAANTVQCFLTQVAAGTCTQDSVTSYNLYDDPESTPNGLGYRQAHGLQLSGGTEALRYFLHGEWESEDGVDKVPEFDQRYMAAHGLSLRPEEQHPNHMDRVTGRTQFNLTLSPKATIDFSAGYTSQNSRLP